MRHLPDNVDFIGRARMDAALYALPLKRQGRGRPRVKGQRLPSPVQRASCRRGWKTLDVKVYGRPARVKVKSFDALWYRAAQGRLLRFIVIRDWPGHKHDDVLCCTDLSLDAAEIIRRYCLRWTLEVTFHDVKGRLGFEDPQNRTRRAVERTAPMALWVYSLVVLWYLAFDKRRWTARLPTDPWYAKTVPAFSDMLAALRKETLQHRLLDPLPLTQRDQKRIAPMIDAIGYGH